MNLHLKTSITQNIIVTFLYILLAFPLFYFVYKYGSPYLGMIDFFDYYKLYDNLDFRSADSPLNMRLVSSFIVYCLSKTGLIYNTMTHIDDAPFSKVIYFNAIFVNYACVVLTCSIIFNIVYKHKNSLVMCFLAGLLFLLGFGTIFYELMPLADAMAITLFAWALQYYYKKSWQIIIPLILLILQREYIFLAFGLIALLDYWKFRNKYYLYCLLLNIVCFAIYILLRKLIFETPRYSHHTNVEFMLGSFTKENFPLIPFIRQTFMTMNVFFIYVIIVIYKKIIKLRINRFEFNKSLFLLGQIIVLTFLLSLGNNAGRYFYMLIPLIIVNIIEELKIFSLDKASISE